MNKSTGRGTKGQNVSSIIDPHVINLYYQKINTDTQYTAPNLLPIPAGNRIPTVDVHTVRTFLTKQKRTSPGQEGLP